MKKQTTDASTRCSCNRSTPSTALTALAMVAVAMSLTLVSCKEVPKEVEITHQRELCKFDENEALRGAVNRFKAKQPLHWRRVAETKNRILNYRVGESTEVALGLFSGSLEANLIRWYGQYGQKVEKVDLSKLQQGKMLDGATYYLAEMQGTLETSMGATPIKNENWSTIGILCKIGGSQLVTIKMTGPAKETAKEKQNLIKYAENLKFISFPEDQK